MLSTITALPVTLTNLVCAETFPITNMIEIHAYAAAIILESTQTPTPAPKKVAAKKSTKKT